jgi:hypothetical protein
MRPHGHDGVVVPDDIRDALMVGYDISQTNTKTEEAYWAEFCKKFRGKWVEIESARQSIPEWMRPRRVLDINPMIYRFY